MLWKDAIALAAVLLFTTLARADNAEKDLSEEAGKKYIEKWDRELSKLTTESSHASWNYESNLTDYNLEVQLEASAKLAKFKKEEWEEYPWETYKDPDLRRQFQKYSFLGPAGLPTEKYERFEKVIKEMEGNYGKAKICDYGNASKCDLHLEPEITERFAESRDPEELKYLWTEWRKASGKPVRKLFTEYVALSNEAAKLNNYSDASEVWLKDYESDDFTDQVEVLWQQVRPLYVQLHAYVRRRLREQYGEDIVSRTGPIPAHLLGNMWAQTWTNILNDTVPYPNKPSLDVTGIMIEQKYTPLKMFKVAEEFFTSLGLSPMPESFWKNSIIEKPKDGRDLICHASAWDFYDGKDFRIKQCTRVNAEDLETVHHEMGHVQYFLQYKDQPIAYKDGANPGRLDMNGGVTGCCEDEKLTAGMKLDHSHGSHSFRIKMCTRVTFDELYTVHHEMGHVQYYLQYKKQPIAYKDGANPGFHEAVGDVMALSVSTPKHFEKIGLLKNVVDDQEFEINQLFKMALSKVAFLPFGYLMDQWRWGVFQGKINESNYNCKWWELREQYQGMQPPTQRGEDDFDPGSKYHIDANVPYIRYFVSFIIQFQFHRSLCIAAGEFDPENPDLKPLHKCDIYQNQKAGELLGKMLKMGSSKPWPDAMEVLTGQRKMDAGALLQYFSILQTWLERENARTGEYIGWEPTSSTCEEERIHYYELEGPDDSSEDDNFVYSYAELVAQNANSFESTGYREKFEPWLNTMHPKSKVNRFELNKNVNCMFNTKAPMTHEDKPMWKKGETGSLNLARRAFRSRPVVREVTGMTEPNSKSKPLDRGEEYRKQQQQQQSPFSKFLYSLGASLARPHAAALDKNTFKASSSRNSSNPSDIMWKSEMVRMQAEAMLKLYDIKDGMAPTVEGNPAVNIASTNSNPRMYIREQQPRGSQLWYPIQMESLPEEKKTAKKSFLHYHYKIRTPVFYNMVLVKKADSNTCIEDQPVNRVKIPHMREQELSDPTIRGYNALYNNRWKTIKLVPVDRNRMMKLRQYSTNVGGNVKETIGKRRTRNGNCRFIPGRSRDLRITSDDINNIIKIYSNVERCSRRRSK